MFVLGIELWSKLIMDTRGNRGSQKKKKMFGLWGHTPYVSTDCIQLSQGCFGLYLIVVLI